MLLCQSCFGRQLFESEKKKPFKWKREREKEKTLLLWTKPWGKDREKRAQKERKMSFILSCTHMLILLILILCCSPFPLFHVYYMTWPLFSLLLFLECPPSEDGMDRFACPSADTLGRYRCIADHSLCDGFIDCPKGEDEDRLSCMFYKTVRTLELLLFCLISWSWLTH